MDMTRAGVNYALAFSLMQLACPSMPNAELPGGFWYWDWWSGQQLLAFMHSQTKMTSGQCTTLQQVWNLANCRFVGFSFIA